MFNNHNLRWGIVVLIVLGVTLLIYQDYESTQTETPQSTTQQTGVDIMSSTNTELDVESESEEKPVVDTTDRSDRVAVIPQSSSDESEEVETSLSEESSSEDSSSIDETSSELSSETSSEQTSESTESSVSSIADESPASDESSSDASSQPEDKATDESQESTESEDSNENETDTKILDPELTFDDIYNTSQMQADQIEPLDLDNYKNMADVIDQTLTEFNVNSKEIGLAYYNFQNKEHYYLNENELITAASISKVPISALYIDLIEKGDYELDTQLTYNDSMFEAGSGRITNEPLRSSYPLEELISEAITHSDNTAMNILKAEYNEKYGNFREDVLEFAGIENAPKDFIESNVSSAYIMEQVLIKIAQDDTYKELIQLMYNTSPTQLFTTYVNNDMMANKYGRYGQSINDTGIYYENNQPQYALVVLTDNVSNANDFLELMNLRVNQYYRAQYQ